MERCTKTEFATLRDFLEKIPQGGKLAKPRPGSIFLLMLEFGPIEYFLRTQQVPVLEQAIRGIFSRKSL